MVPNKFNMVDMGGIDVLESQGVEVPGLYQRLVDSIALCKYQCLYNWDFDGILIAPTYVELTIEDDAVKINDYIQVTSDDVIHIHSIETQPVVQQLTVNANGEYVAPEGVDGYSPVIVEVDTVLTGTVIFYAGVTAPAGYLACDGTTYSISDYPQLSEFIEDNYGSVDYFGGDGETTFAVPDWRGEFFRASGQNSRTGQGSGGSVGEHQNATMQNRVAADYGLRVGQVQANTSGWVTVSDADALETSPTHYWMNISSNSVGVDASESQRYASRPTNTSLLVCIKT